MRCFTLSILAFLAACGGSPPATPDASADATVSAADARVDAALVPSDAAGTCMVVTDVGSAVMEMKVATAISAPLGGTIVDGTYALTALTVYTGAGGTSGPTGTIVSQTSYLAGELSHVVTTTSGTPSYQRYVVEASGTAVQITQTCPSTAPLSFDGYTSANGVVTFYDSHGAASREYTLVP